MGKVITQQELLFRRFADLPPIRRAALGMALNPNAPEDVLLRLAAQPEAREVLATRKTALPPPLLDALLADPSPATLRALAANPATPWPVRRDLAERSDDADVRAAVAQTRRPDDPGDDAAWESLLRRLAADPDPRVRSAVAWNLRTPADVAETLAVDPEPSVRRSLASWGRAEPEFAAARRALLSDPDPEIRHAAMVNPSGLPIPADLADGLLLHAKTLETAILGRNIPISEHAAATISADSPDYRPLLAAHPLLPAGAVAALAADESALVRAMVATRGDISEDLRASLIATLPPDGENAEIEDFLVEVMFSPADAPDCALAVGSAEAGLAGLASGISFLRRAAALSAPLPLETLAGLFDDPDKTVSTAAVHRHPSPPADVLERVVRRGGVGRLTGRVLVHHPALSPDAWVRFADDKDPWLRSQACQKPWLSAAVVGRLAQDPDDRVRAAAAGHPNLPQGCVANLVNDPGRSVAESMGESPAFPLEWMQLLLDEAGC